MDTDTGLSWGGWLVVDSKLMTNTYQELSESVESQGNGL